MNNIEQLEPFEKRIVRIFALIASFVTFLIAYFILISTAYLEFVPTVFPSHVPLQLITSAVAILYLVYFIVFIIKAIKKNDQTDLKNMIIMDIQTILMILAEKYIKSMFVPEKTIFIILAAVCFVSAVIFSIVSNKDGRKGVIFYFVITYIAFAAFGTGKILFTQVIYPGDDFNTKVFVLQTQERTDETDRNISVVNIPHLTSSVENGFETYNAFSDDCIVYTKKEKDEYIENIYSIINADNNVKPSQKAAYIEAADNLNEELSKYDDSFFKDKFLVILESYFFFELSNAKIKAIVNESTRDTLYFYSDIESSDKYSENEGYLFFFISIPNKYKSFIQADTVRHISRE